ncbi:hypothetical protein CPB83DRAFT_850242 [Crepidotus variabilis]|uniref:Uncharacterized protein n=1 Tax=Crepidotus variabilis TaxID=179855 RepID=A0A9P6EKF1_9AGAR|nr:hypothetical protein CPB83DRAFT_850242 [Crepidotus variabilis]
MDSFSTILFSEDSASTYRTASTQAVDIANSQSSSNSEASGCSETEILVEYEKNGTWCTSNYYCVVA